MVELPEDWLSKAFKAAREEVEKMTPEERGFYDRLARKSDEEMGYDPV